MMMMVWERCMTHATASTSTCSCAVGRYGSGMKRHVVISTCECRYRGGICCKRGDGRVGGGVLQCRGMSPRGGVALAARVGGWRAARVLVVGVPVVKLGYAEKNSSTMVSLHRMIVCHSLDDMADQEMEKMRSSRGQYRASQRDFEELMRVIPDPAQEEDGLLAEDELSSAWSDTDPLQSWDGLDGSTSLLDTGALSSLPYGDAEAAEAAAASEGVPTYRGGSSKSGGRGDGRPFTSSIPPVLPTNRAFRKPGTQTPEEAALEDYLMEKAVEEAMSLHHERLENAHSRYSIAVSFGQILEEIEQEDVWRNAEPLLPGTELRMPTWIRASEAMSPLLDELNEATKQFELEESEARIQQWEDRIIDEVESARKLLSLTDPKAGLSVEMDASSGDALDELFGDDETLLPGTADLLDGEEGELRRLTEGKENSIMNSLLEEILPEVGGYALDYADLVGEAGGPGMFSGALQALTDEVDSALEEADRENRDEDSEMEDEEGEDEDEDAVVDVAEDEDEDAVVDVAEEEDELAEEE